MTVITRVATFLGALALAMGLAWQSQAGTFNRGVSPETFRSRNLHEAPRPAPPPRPVAVDHPKASPATGVAPSEVRSRGLHAPATPTPLSEVTARKSQPLSAFPRHQAVDPDTLLRRHPRPRGVSQ